MTKDSTVAPKERINIVFKPSTGDLKEEVELPLRLMMLGDYSLSGDDSPIEGRMPVNVNKNNFNDVLSSKNIELDLSVKNALSDVGGEISAHLLIKSISDFEPEAIARQIPELSALLDLREALTTLKGPMGNVPAFRKYLQNLITNDNSRRQLLAELSVLEDDV